MFTSDHVRALTAPRAAAGRQAGRGGAAALAAGADQFQITFHGDSGIAAGIAAGSDDFKCCNN